MIKQKRKAIAKVLHDKNQPQETGNVKDLLADLKACSRTRSLLRGKRIHNKAIKCRHDTVIYVANALINMYSKCGSMDEARQVFDSLKHPTVVSWNSLILGYAENGQGHTALELLTKMEEPESTTFMAAFKACTTLVMEARGSGCRGKALHNLAVMRGCDSDVFVQSTLIDMYAKIGKMVDARQVFDSLKHPNVVSWTALILGYADSGEGLSALKVFTSMRNAGAIPDSVTFLAALKACTSLVVTGTNWTESWKWGKEIHKLVSESDCSSNVYVQSTLVDMYAKSGSMVDAREVFDIIEHPTVVSWNALISGYADNGQSHTALQLFNRMRIEGPAPDTVTFLAAIQSCNSLGDLDRGKALHELVRENDYSADVYVQSSLVCMYAKCGSMADARQVFDSIDSPTVVFWNALIMGYTDNGLGHTALDLFITMRCIPDSVTFVCTLKACTSLEAKEAMDRGKALENVAIEYGCNSDTYVQNTLIDMYAKSHNMVDARRVFDSMKRQTVVSWNVLIMGYADNGQGLSSLELFTRMRKDGPAPDSVTFSVALKACALLGALDFGRKIHSELGNDLDVVLLTCLVDLYAKCGSLMEAQRVFDLHAEIKNLITWNALLAGFSNCGDSEAVFGLFEGMQDVGYRPDGVTLLCILTCCSHAGLVEKGKEFFDAMPTKYGIIPTLEHYNCMIDNFGRVNRLDDAMALLRRMPYTDEVTWMTILDACRKWKNVSIGRVAFESLKNFNNRDAAGYVLMEQLICE